MTNRTAPTVPRSPISRRTLLRGAGGVSIALPFLEAMAPRRAFAQQGGAPKRLCTFLIENGVVPSAWFPTGTEKDFTMGKILDPLIPHKANLIIPDGLDNKTSGGTCHAIGRAGALTGQNNASGRARGISIDQAVANHVSKGTAIKSLETSVYLKRNFVYSLFHSGPGEPVFPEDDPAKVFERLFSNGVPQAGGQPMMPGQDFAALRARKKSILDHAMTEYQRILGTLGATDKARLDRHMNGIREIERGLDVLGTGGGMGPSASCTVPAAPVGSDFPAHTKLQTELSIMAMACDLTRVTSIQTRASLTSFTWLGVNNGQHAISHQQGSAGPDGQLNKIATWFTENVAAMIALMKSTPDSDGKTLFDNTLLFYANDLGTGPHSRKRYPFLLATGQFTLPDGKVLQTGRYLKYPNGTAHNDLLASIAAIMGLPPGKFGAYGNGPLPGLA